MPEYKKSISYESAPTSESKQSSQALKWTFNRLNPDQKSNDPIGMDCQGTTPMDTETATALNKSITNFLDDSSTEENSKCKCGELFSPPRSQILQDYDVPHHHPHNSLNRLNTIEDDSDWKSRRCALCTDNKIEAINNEQKPPLTKPSGPIIRLHSRCKEQLDQRYPSNKLRSPITSDSPPTFDTRQDPDERDSRESTIRSVQNSRLVYTCQNGDFTSNFSQAILG